MKKIKLIAVDMDGTFLHSDMTYDRKRFRSIYNNMKDKGIKFVVASGNQYYQLKSFFEDYQDELTYVAENGALIIEDNKEISSVKIPKEVALKVIETCSEYENVKIGVCGKSSAYILKGQKDFYDEMIKYYHRLEEIRDFNKIDDQILKLALVTPSELTYEIRDMLLPIIGKSLIPVVSGHDSIDLISPGRNKGYGIALLQEKWGIDPSECIAFGDSGNDIEMLKQVKYGYAMKNASEEVKAIANYTAEKNDSDGVLNVIEQYL